jgi:hypothetical protein
MLIEILEVKKKQQRGIYQYLTNDDISRGFIYIYIEREREIDRSILFENKSCKELSETIFLCPCPTYSCTWFDGCLKKYDASRKRKEKSNLV